MSQILALSQTRAATFLSLDGVDLSAFRSPLRTETEEFRDDARLDVDAMVATLRATKGRSYSACPNVADWEKAFGESGDVLAFTITSSLSGSYSAACVAKQSCEERDSSRRIRVVDTLGGAGDDAAAGKRQPPRSATAHRLTRCAALWRSCNGTHLLFSLSRCTISRKTGASASSRRRRRACSASAPLDRRARRERSRCSARRGERKTQEFLLQEMERLGYKGGSVRIGHCGNAAFSLELYTELRRRFPNADVRRYPLRACAATMPSAAAS